MRRAVAIVAVTAALLAPSTASAQQPVWVDVLGCVIVIEMGTYSWSPPYGPISAQGPTVTFYNCPIP